MAAARLARLWLTGIIRRDPSVQACLRNGLLRLAPDATACLLLLHEAGRVMNFLISRTDVPVYDESGYLLAGLSRFPLTPEWGPIYACWYRLLSFLQSDPLVLLFVNRMLLMGPALAFSFYLLLRLRGSAPLVSFVFADLLLISSWNLAPEKHACHFASVFLFLALAFSGLIRSKSWSLAFLGAAAGTAAFIRPEYLLSFIVLPGLLLTAFRRASCGRQGLAQRLALMIIPFFMFASLWGSPTGGTRSASAFRQGFIRSADQWRRVEGLPRTSARLLYSQHFGRHRTLPTALRANPRAFLRHLASNARGAIRVMMRGAKPVVAPGGSRLYWILFAALVTLAFFEQNTFKIRRSALGSAVPLGVLALPSIVIALVFSPSIDYLLPLAGISLAAAAPHLSIVRSRTLLLVAAVGILAFARPVTPSNLARQGRPALQAILTLRKYQLPRCRSALLSGRNLVHYFSPHCSPIHLLAKKGSFDTFLQEYPDVDLVLLPARISREFEFFSDPTWRKFIAFPEQYEFEKVADGNVLVRRGLWRR